MKSKFLPWIAVAMVAIVTAIMIIAGALRKPGPDPVSVEDARTTADAALAEKFSGPRYFNGSANTMHDEGGTWITVHEAMVQVPRIAAERKLGPEGARQIEQLIGQLGEPHPYRMIGGPRVNLVRLNLSLDAIK